jgi:hypothetical protein
LFARRFSQSKTRSLQSVSYLIISENRFSKVLQGLGRRFRDVWRILSADHNPLIRRLTILTFLALAIELFSFSGKFFADFE